ncbi:MAG: Hpt domain protein [bacterium ADurb.Bin243]|nr:MAG: Hpt domain protein [bacterium ADurb.Bin243]HOD40413.1 Hpt domain-containing protein [Candidatus Wallbacteria bacterium]
MNSRPASDDTIPSDIAGLDTANGLRRALGNAKLYLSMLRNFAAGQKRSVAQVRAAIGRGDFKAAAILAHTTKGVAGNIGAVQVQKLAEALEKSINDRKPAEDIETLLGALSDPLEKLVAALEPLLTAYQNRPKADVDMQKLRAVCIRLKTLLGEDDAESVDFFDENADLLNAAFPDQYAAIDAAVRSFNFETAVKVLEDAAAKSVLKEID